LIKSFKALDNIRNTQVGHIMIDYRIACAMSNLFHKPICPDGNNSVKIAKKITDKTKINVNKLEFLLTKHLDTKLITPIDLSEINDFPKLTPSELKQEIFLGSFQFKQCTSYVPDMLKNGEAFIINNELLKKIPDINLKNDLLNSKIIAVEILSRHKRSRNKAAKNASYVKKFRTIYKVFIQYLSNISSPNSIKCKI
jgi:predicted oxidoreductase